MQTLLTTSPLQVDASQVDATALSAANALATLGRNEEALAAYEKTLDIYARAENPPWRVKSQALTWLGVINRRLKKNKEAIDWLRRSVQFHASHENRHHLAISLAMDVQVGGRLPRMFFLLTPASLQPLPRSLHAP